MGRYSRAKLFGAKGYDSHRALVLCVFLTSNVKFVVMTDASDLAIGAILEQDFGSGFQPIAFSSQKLNATKIRYSTCERELLGIVWAIGPWKHYF